jgi:hypothetical protein
MRLDAINHSLLQYPDSTKALLYQKPINGHKRYYKLAESILIIKVHLVQVPSTIICCHVFISQIN